MNHQFGKSQLFKLDTLNEVCANVQIINVHMWRVSDLHYYEFLFWTPAEQKLNRTVSSARSSSSVVSAAALLSPAFFPLLRKKRKKRKADW